MNRWDSFIYFFVVGGTFFVLTLWLPIRRKDVRLKKRSDRLTFLFVVIGGVLYFLIYLLWQLYAVGGQ